ncbi:MAG: hypothetical protein NC340_07885 [Ruminococcus flavefaciens]|nr:hypothetical protein [Ruminococcus flavefaciens]MCM1228667.1 hypothetical protein [Ruminococcus flavefaciens]
MNKKIFCGALAMCMAVSLTGCGKENVDVSAKADIVFGGYNGYGTATVSEGAWIRDIETQFCSGMSFMDIALLEETLADAVDFSLSSTENLSNGDEVVLTVNVDNTALENYDFKLSGGSKTYTVSGLDEIESFDPFEGVAVNFSGMSPNGSASVNTADLDIDISLSYTLDKTSGLKNGDEVTLSIGAYGGSDVEEYCLGKGMIPTATEKTFTVEGLAGYAQKLEEIPEDSLNKMISQAEDSFNSKAASWAEGNSLKNTELLGYYFLTPKEGFSSSYGNQLYCVFKETAEITGYTEEEAKKDSDERKKEPHEETYYTYYKYSNIVILDDGTCSFDLSTGSMPSSTIKTKHGYLSWGYFERYSLTGYSDLDSMFNDCVTSQISNYNYENTVE